MDNVVSTASPAMKAIMSRRANTMLITADYTRRYRDVLKNYG